MKNEKNSTDPTPNGTQYALDENRYKTKYEKKFRPIRKYKSKFVCTLFQPQLSWNTWPHSAYYRTNRLLKIKVYQSNRTNYVRLSHNVIARLPIISPIREMHKIIYYELSKNSSFTQIKI